MTDTRTKQQRRRIMQAVKTKDTGPEIIVRRALHREGYRYSLHQSDLPGKPDIVFPRKKKAIFVHGCFWHGHNCKKGKAPKSRLDYWGPKLKANRQRDARRLAELKALGWQVLTVWQCETIDIKALMPKLIAFVNESGKAKK
jgi:DNA mismatch endonuclease (patch repair protein)